MPKPETLAQYDAVVPGAGDRILKAFEAVTVDASARDDRLAETERWLRKVGLGWIIFFALLLFVSGIVFFGLGNNVAGGILVGLPVLTGLTTIVVTPLRNRPDRRESE